VVFLEQHAWKNFSIALIEKFPDLFSQEVIFMSNIFFTVLGEAMSTTILCSAGMIGIRMGWKIGASPEWNGGIAGSESSGRRCLLRN
jgi:TRAP-type uncharacterized transport system fused permease subunit